MSYEHLVIGGGGMKGYIALGSLISINNYKFHLPAMKNFNLLFENPSQLLEEQDSFKSQSKITFENEINIGKNLN